MAVPGSGGLMDLVLFSFLSNKLVLTFFPVPQF